MDESSYRTEWEQSDERIRIVPEYCNLDELAIINTWIDRDFFESNNSSADRQVRKKKKTAISIG